VEDQDIAVQTLEGQPPAKRRTRQASIPLYLCLFASICCVKDLNDFFNSVTNAK